MTKSTVDEAIEKIRPKLLEDSTFAKNLSIAGQKELNKGINKLKNIVDPTPRIWENHALHIVGSSVLSAFVAAWVASPGGGSNTAPEVKQPDNSPFDVPTMVTKGDNPELQTLFLPANLYLAMSEADFRRYGLHARAETRDSHDAGMAFNRQAGNNGRAVAIQEAELLTDSGIAALIKAKEIVKADMERQAVAEDRRQIVYRLGRETNDLKIYRDPTPNDLNDLTLAGSTPVPAP